MPNLFQICPVSKLICHKGPVQITLHKPRKQKKISHRIFRYMHGVLNEVYLQNFLYGWAVNRETNLMSLLDHGLINIIRFVSRFTTHLCKIFYKQTSFSNSNQQNSIVNFFCKTSKHDPIHLLTTLLLATTCEHAVMRTC